MILPQQGGRQQTQRLRLLPVGKLERDQGGTLTGRLSYAHPNLQQLPNYNEYGTGIRSLFLPNSQKERWGCFDYSQQEPRLVVHYASLQRLMGVDKFVTAYKEDKDTDFHGIVSEMANIPREQAKTINLEPLNTEGIKAGEWILVDLGEIIIHIMLPRTRDFYLLEKLWAPSFTNTA